jgi:hypothetical protein
MVDKHNMVVDEADDITKFDLDLVIQSFIHHAASLIEDNNISKDRKTKRIELLLKVLDQDKTSVQGANFT